MIELELTKGRDKLKTACINSGLLSMSPQIVPDV